MPTNKNRRKAWKGATGSINATAETWKLAKLNFGWKSIGDLRVGDQPAVNLIDLDAEDGDLKITIPYSRDHQIKLERLFRRLIVNNNYIRIILSLNELEILFDRGVIRVWIKSQGDLVGADEVALFLAPVVPVTKKGRDVVLKSS